MLRKASYTPNEFFNGKHRYEHWYRDNTVYFITTRCRDRYPAFASEAAKSIFWDRFNHYAGVYGFVPWVTSLMDNHYHTIGYLKIGDNLGPFMQKFHGSTAKLVNDLLPERRVPFFLNAKHHDYYDGCLRDVLQTYRAYRYVRNQSVRHGPVTDYRDYSHTRINIDCERGIQRAVQLNAFLAEVPYARYQNQNRQWSL